MRKIIRFDEIDTPEELLKLLQNFQDNLEIINNKICLLDSCVKVELNNRKLSRTKSRKGAKNNED